MATWMEAPVESLEPGVMGEVAALLEDPLSEIDSWVVLDTGIWPGDPSGHDRELTAARDVGPPICDVIVAWRAADRELAGLAEDDPEWNRVHAELVGLRALHHRLFEARMGESPRGDEFAARWRSPSWPGVQPRYPAA